MLDRSSNRLAWIGKEGPAGDVEGVLLEWYSLSCKCTLVLALIVSGEQKFQSTGINSPTKIIGETIPASAGASEFVGKVSRPAHTLTILIAKSKESLGI